MAFAAFISGVAGVAALAQEVGDGAPPPTPTPQAATPKAKKAVHAAEPQLRKREELVVTATRTEQSAEEVPVSVTVVPREAMVESPTRTLDDALRTVVGLNLPLGNSNLIQPTTNNVSMRGLGGNRALVLLDGVPQNDAVGGYIHWNKVPIEAVERVEVARGAAASLFGNYAMGGVVNIFTRALEPGRVAADASFGSFNTTRVSASGADRLGEGVNLGVFANYENTDGYNRTPPEDRGAIDIPSSSRTLNVMTKLDFKTTSGLATFLKGGVVDQDMGQGTPISNNTQRIYDVAGGGTVLLGGSTLSANASYQQMDYTLTGSTLVPGAGRDEEYQSTHTEQPGWDVGGSVQ
jgi:outer membrane receptor protein involved in Fe transport